MLWPEALTFSRKFGIPKFTLLETTYYPRDFLALSIRMSDWSVVERTEQYCVMKNKDNTLRLSLHYADTLIREWWKLWEPFYLPPFSLRGKTVLDIGAGCGETAYFYLSHGASKIVAIEREKMAARLLEENVKSNRWNVEVIGEPFKVEHLLLNHDFMKMDIEGAESELLRVAKLGPCVIEAHTRDLAERLCSKHSLKVKSWLGGLSILAS